MAHVQAKKWGGHGRPCRPYAAAIDCLHLRENFRPCEHLTLYVWGALTLVYLLQGYWHPLGICVSSFWSSPHDVCPLRVSGLLKENGCITTVPEWREGGHVRGGGPSPRSLVVGWEAKKKRNVRELVEDMSVWDTYHTSSKLHLCDVPLLKCTTD